MGDGPGDERGARVFELRQQSAVGLFESATCLFKFSFLEIIYKLVVHISLFYLSMASSTEGRVGPGILIGSCDIRGKARDRLP